MGQKHMDPEQKAIETTKELILSLEARHKHITNEVYLLKEELYDLDGKLLASHDFIDSLRGEVND